MTVIRPFPISTREADTGMSLKFRNEVGSIAIFVIWHEYYFIQSYTPDLYGEARELARRTALDVCGSCCRDISTKFVGDLSTGISASSITFGEDADQTRLVTLGEQLVRAFAHDSLPQLSQSIRRSNPQIIFGGVVVGSLEEVIQKYRLI